MNASTHADFTNYYDYLPANQLELALWLESDRMRSLKITPENLQNQKEAVKEEKRLSYDNQAYWPALLKMDEMVFRNWANSHSTIGSMEDLDAASIADVKQFFETYYAPNNAVLAIAGTSIRFKPNDWAQYFARFPATISASGRRHRTRSRSSGARLSTDRSLSSALAIAWKIPARNSADFYPIALLKSMLLDARSAQRVIAH